MPPPTDLHALLAHPKPFDQLLSELIAYLGIRQGDIVEATGLNKAAVSRLVNGKTKPSLETLGKMHHAFTEEFGIPTDLLTYDYLVACLNTHAEDKLSPRVSNLNEWLNAQPEAVQNGFWEQAEAFIRTIESLRNPRE